MVTELLSGETLRERLKRGTPGERPALLLMLQAARGLEAAHAKGIVHRDLKPENVFVTTDGRVKVLDFGLAKLVALESAASVEETASSPTQDGMLVGTVGYMSPEQVRGLPVDARSDVFSFGVVLYELVSGKHPFRRETTVGTLSAVLEGAPAELSSVVKGVSPAVSAGSCGGAWRRSGRGGTRRVTSWWWRWRRWRGRRRGRRCCRRWRRRARTRGS